MGQSVELDFTNPHCVIFSGFEAGVLAWRQTLDDGAFERIRRRKASRKNHCSLSWVILPVIVGPDQRSILVA